MTQHLASLVERLRELTSWYVKDRDANLVTICSEAADTIESLNSEVMRLKRTIVQAAVPLEGLLASRQWVDLAPNSWAEIENAVEHIRASLQERGG